MKRPKTLVIHSGTYKTGTSAIQVYLERARHFGVLAAADACYPRTGRSAGVQHSNLTAELRNGPAFVPRQGGWDDLLAEVTAGDMATTIVSTEHFSALRPDQLDVIGRKCHDAGVHVRWVHYLREQASFYNAFYVERLVAMLPEYRELINRPFEEFGSWSPIDLSFLRYAEFSEQILAAIPGVDLRLRPYSRAHLIGGDVIEDFCRVAEVPFAPEYASSTNVGTGWRTVETARRITPIIRLARPGLQLKGVPNGGAVRMRWHSLIRSELVKATTDLGWNVESAVYMTADFRERLQAQYAEHNARVSEVAGFDWPAIVAEEGSRPYNIGDYNEVSASDFCSILERVVPMLAEPPSEIRELMEDPAAAAPARSVSNRAFRVARRWWSQR
jgi:hypothetical protein